jgi:hypothetical protein
VKSIAASFVTLVLAATAACSREPTPVNVAAAPAVVAGARLWVAEGYAAAAAPQGWVVTRRGDADVRQPIRIEVTLTKAPPCTPGRRGERTLERLGTGGSAGEDVRLTYRERLGRSDVVYRQVRQQDGAGTPIFELDALMRSGGLYVTGV